MTQHEVLAAAFFVGLALALMALFAVLERRYKERLTAVTPETKSQQRIL